MRFELFAYPALFLLGFTSLALLMLRDWRSSILILSLQYVGVFVLVAISWPLAMALVKLVAGWIAGAALGMASAEVAADERSMALGRVPSNSNIAYGRISGIVFRFFAAAIVFMAVLSLVPEAQAWIPGIVSTQIIAGLMLIGLGLLNLGLSSAPFRVVIGLLTVLAGFEILYASVEVSALVAGLLASVNLALALTGAYMLVAPAVEDAE